MINYHEEPFLVFNHQQSQARFYSKRDTLFCFIWTIHFLNF